MERVQPRLALQLAIEQALDPLERALPLVPSMRAMELSIELGNNMNLHMVTFDQLPTGISILFGVCSNWGCPSYLQRYLVRCRL